MRDGAGRNEVVMTTKETTREQISALADGELQEQQLDKVLGALRQSEHHADWEIYHQIGDVLRSDEMAVTLSPGFTARMAARLEAEAPILAPGCANGSLNPLAKHSLKRWAIPSAAAAAAMAAMAFVATPQLMVAMKAEPAAKASVAIASSSGELASVVMTSASGGGVVLRDPRIDDYLLAHQRFSPSVYSTAQYARTATFATDSNK